MGDKGLKITATYDEESKEITLRDYFANSAMQGILSGNVEAFSNGMGVNFRNLAIESYVIADEMLKARSAETNS